MKKQLNVKGIIGLLLFISIFILEYKLVGGYFVNFIDYPTIICIILFTAVSLYAGSQWKYFFLAVKTSFIETTEKIEKTKVKQMEYAIDYTIKTVVVGGVLLCFIGFVGLMQNITDASTIGPNIAVAVLSIVWSSLIIAVLIPIKGRVHSLLK